MANVVSALTNILDTGAMLENFALLIPVIGGVLLFSFTYRIIRRMVKGTAKGKANI